MRRVRTSATPTPMRSRSRRGAPSVPERRRRTRPVDAPSAMRIPISCVRWPTLYERADQQMLLESSDGGFRQPLHHVRLGHVLWIRRTTIVFPERHALMVCIGWVYINRKSPYTRADL